jgi:ABC-type molybdenum transport system ATPase subunit/photorepair protein PhrA
MDSTLLRIEGLQVNINGKEILYNISFEIKPGEQWAVFGAAGSGKTVLAHNPGWLSCLSGAD